MEEEGQFEVKKVGFNSGAKTSKVGHEQVQNLLFGEKLSWKAIIYDLINTEQLNPWDVDISLLATRYLEKVRELEEHNFFISSKVLLAASLLLRIKSEILLNFDLVNLNDALFGKKEEKKYVQERIYLDDEIPDLVPRTPLPRFKKVSLQELMAALSHAIKTETRRIRRVTTERQYEMEVAVAMPKRRINLQEEIKNVYSKLKNIFSTREERLAFSEFAGESREDKIAHFVPLLHLDNQQKVWLEQEGHFEEIWIWLKELYNKKNATELIRMEKEVDEEIRMSEIEENNRKIEEKSVNDKTNNKNSFEDNSTSNLENNPNENDEELKKEIRDSFKNPLGEQVF